MTSRTRSVSIVLAWRLVRAWLALRSRFPNWMQMLLVYLVLALSLTAIALSASWNHGMGRVLFTMGLGLAGFALLWKIVLGDAIIHASNAGPLGARVFNRLLGRQAITTTLALCARTNAHAAGWRFPACPAYLECVFVNWAASPQALSRWQEKWLESVTPLPSSSPRRANRL